MSDILSYLEERGGYDHASFAALAAMRIVGVQPDTVKELHYPPSTKSRYK